MENGQGAPEQVQVQVVRREDEVESARGQASEILETFREFEIESAEDFELAAECLREIKGVAKRVKEQKELATKPMNQALSQVRSWFRPAETVLLETEKLLKRKIAQWTEEQSRRSRLAMEAAAAASQRGDFDGAHEASKGIVEAPTAAGISMTQRWDYLVEDLSKVPREYLCVDHSAVRLHMKRAGAGTPEAVPGLRFFQARSVTARVKS